MSTEANKTIVRRLFQAQNEQDIVAIETLISPHFVGHLTMSPEPLHGPESVKQATIAYHTAFSDFHLTIEEEIAEGDKVVVSWIARGTHQGAI